MSGDPSKRRLLEAAGEEFAEKGFDGASIRSICKRAEMNVAAVNYHYGDKEQLYIEAVLEAHRCGKTQLVPDEEMIETDPVEALRVMIGGMVRDMVMSARDDWHDALMYREMLKPTGATNAIATRVIRPRFERLLKILGAICPDLADDRRLHAIAFSIVGQSLFYRVGRSISEHLIGEKKIAEMDVDFLVEHITQFSLAALGHAAPIVEPVETTQAKGSRP